MRRRFLILLFVAAGCVDTTGGDLFTFSAYAAGTAEARRFPTPRNYEVVLERASLHIGAVYLNAARANTNPTSCVLNGIYVAQVTSALTIDALAPDPQPFPQPGEATAGEVLTGELWLSGGDINAHDDSTVILDVRGTARAMSSTTSEIPFEAQLTIGSNRIQPIRDASLPGSNPICKQRIVSPIMVDLKLDAGGLLVVEVDPRGWFSNVDFSRLRRDESDPSLFRFIDGEGGQPDQNLYLGMRSGAGAYQLSWRKSGGQRSRR